VLLLLILGLTLVGVCAALVAHAVALPRLRAMERVDQITAYGFGSEAAAEAPQRRLSSALERLARALGAFVGGRLRGTSEAELRRELLSAGLYDVSPVTIVGYRVLGALALPVLFVWYCSSVGAGGALVLLGAPLMVAIGWTIPLTLVRRKSRRRLERVDYELPELVDLLVVTVESGMALAASMQLAAGRVTGPLGDELRLVIHEQAMGLPADQALANMLERSPTDGMRSFVRSIRQGEALGVSIGQIMRSLSDEMRKRRQGLAEERAQRAPLKILFPLAALIFPSIFVVLLAPAVLNFLETFGGGL
jgi:tight adherence protein C